MKARHLRLALGFVLGTLVCTPSFAVVYLEAGFDDKAVDQPIGTGGAELGEPVSVSPLITATVRGEPMPTPFLEIQDNDDYGAGSVVFEFLGSTEVTSGMVVISVNLWFPEFEQFFLYVREQGGAAENFTSLRFTDTGSVSCTDENGSVGNIGTYATGRHFPVRIAYNMDLGIYSIWLDGVLVLSAEEHGVTGRGVGSLLFGCTNDPDYDGRLYVDDLFVADYPGAKHYLRANFNYKTLDAPIGTGGPEIGEPIYVDAPITAIVREAPMFTPSLEIQDIDDYAAGYAHFEFIGDAEVQSGVLVIRADLWFDIFDEYRVVVREHGGAAYKFSDLHFTSDGYVLISDAGGYLAEYGTYDVGRVYPIMIVHNLDAGTYNVWLDGYQVVSNEPHGIPDRGIGRVAIGTGHDANYDGLFYVDNLWVSESSGPTSAVCCIGETCGRMIAGDCAYNSGEFHSDLWSCEPNPCVPAGVAAIEDGVGTMLLPAMPNPTGGTTRLRYRLEQPGELRLVVVDATGRLVRTLLSGKAGAGAGSIEWDRRNDAGALVGAGVYFGRLSADGTVVSRRMIVLE